VLLEKAQSSGTYIRQLPSGGPSNVLIICSIVTFFVALVAFTCSNSSVVFFVFDHLRQCRHVVCIVVFCSKLVMQNKFKANIYWWQQQQKQELLLMLMLAAASSEQ